MKKYFIYIFLSFLIFSCETEVDPSLDESLNILVIDAFLTSNDPIQHINITRSQAYFDDSFPVKVEGAIVTVTNLTDSSVPVYTFQEQQDRYTWQSGDGSTLGTIGHQYELRVELNGNTFTSITSLEDAPPVDSIEFRLEEGNSFVDDLILAELIATDLEGLNDTYLIKTWKNGELLGQPGQINIAYDAAFSPSEENDAVKFIQPIRDGVNPFDDARNGDELSPYNLPDSLFIKRDTSLLASDTIFLGAPSIFYSDKTPFGVIVNERIVIANDNNKVPVDLKYIPRNDDRFIFSIDDKVYLKGDSIYVEIHSISNEAFFFLNQVIIETTREGGFGALFATPLANVSTNIVPENQSEPVLGFFNIATVSSGGARLNSEDQVRIVE